MSKGDDFVLISKAFLFKLLSHTRTNQLNQSKLHKSYLNGEKILKDYDQNKEKYIEEINSGPT